MEEKKQTIRLTAKEKKQERRHEKAAKPEKMAKAEKPEKEDRRLAPMMRALKAIHSVSTPGSMEPEELAKQMDQEVVQSTFAEARKNGGLIEITDHAEDLKGADVIYGDVWASMGEEAQIPERVGLLSPFRVTMDTLKATENPDVLYLHCLPSFHDFETKMAKEWQAKGVDIREVTDEVFRSRHSVVFDEAENRMHSIKAVMVATIGA